MKNMSKTNLSDIVRYSGTYNLRCFTKY